MGESLPKDTVWRACRVCKGTGCRLEGYGDYKLMNPCKHCNGQGYVLGPKELPREGE